MKTDSEIGLCVIVRKTKTHRPLDELISARRETKPQRRRICKRIKERRRSTIVSAEKR